MVGTGIFATPSTIFALSGSVGLSLFIWVAGMIIAAAGMAVYLEFGTAIPRNGGEKNYLEFVYGKPKYLATGMYAGYVVLLGMFARLSQRAISKRVTGFADWPTSRFSRLGGFELGHFRRIHLARSRSRGQQVEPAWNWTCLHHSRLPYPWLCVEMGSATAEFPRHHQADHCPVDHRIWLGKFANHVHTSVETICES